MTTKGTLKQFSDTFHSLLSKRSRWHHSTTRPQACPQQARVDPRPRSDVHAELLHPTRPRFNDTPCICCFGCAGRVTSGPRRSSNSRHCWCWFCRGAVPRTTWRSSFIIRHCVCCSGGAVRATSPGKRRSSFTRNIREFWFRRGPLLCNSRRLSFPSRLYGRCSGGSVAICSDQDGPVSSRPSASSGSVVVLCFSIPEGRASTEDPAIPDSVVALCFAIPRSRALPAGLAAAVTPALGVLFALGHDGPAPPEDTATLDSVAALCFSNSEAEIHHHQQTL